MRSDQNYQANWEIFTHFQVQVRSFGNCLAFLSMEVKFTSKLMRSQICSR